MEVDGNGRKKELGEIYREASEMPKTCSFPLIPLISLNYYFVNKCLLTLPFRTAIDPPMEQWANLNFRSLTLTEGQSRTIINEQEFKLPWVLIIFIFWFSTENLLFYFHT
jgi:hypothetical protein